MKILMKIKPLSLIVVILILPSCGRIIDWSEKNFAQAPALPSNVVQAQKYIRSITLYDQLTTRARFDALWLSDEVRINHAQLYALKFGKTEEQKKIFLRRQLEENNHFITFYLLTTYNCPLGNSDSEWTFFLSINGKNYAPIEIKAIDLSPEYIHIFDKKYNRFKVPYIIKFDAKDVNDQSLITAHTQQLALWGRSLKSEVVLEWDIPLVNRKE
jgi:hypothetical protein